jgi:branched-chain amino acid transport system permease protein
MVFVLLSIGLNLIVGFSGLLDLGYAACFAIGAYTAGSLTNLGGLLRPDMATSPDFLLVLALSVGAAGLFGLLNAALTMRLRGEYLAIVTLAFGQMVPQLFLNLDDWTGGMRGLSALPPPSLFAHKLSTPIERYYLALGLVALASLVCLRLARSRIGRAWTALSIDELAAMSSGVDRGYARLTAFALGAGMAGAAGALFAASFSFVNPTQSEFRVSAMILAMVVIGGAGSVPGAVIGALAVAGYDQVLIPLLGAWLQQVAENPELSWVSVLDPRGLNFLSFGLALYLTVLLRQRRRAPQAAEADELQPSMA